MNIPSLKGIGQGIQNIVGTAEVDVGKMANAVKDFFGKDLFNEITKVSNAIKTGSFLPEPSPQLKQLAQQAQQSATANESPLTKIVLSSVAPGVQSFIEGGVQKYISDVKTTEIQKQKEQTNYITKYNQLKSQGKNDFQIQKEIGSSPNVKLMQNIAMGFVGGESGMAKDVFSKIASETNPKVISNILKDIKIPESLANSVSEKLAKITNPEEVKNVISSIADPVQRVITALKEIKPLRSAQEAGYTAERGTRIAKFTEIGKTTSGESGFYSQLGAMKGELPKAEFTAIRDKIGGQETVDALFNKVKTSPTISEWEKISTGNSLANMFEGKIPTEGEIVNLEKVFGQDFTSAIRSNQPLFDKIARAGYELANVPRALMSSFDLSAPFRQGIFLSGSKEFYQAMPDMLKSFGTEKGYQALQESITANPLYELARKAKVPFTSIGSNLTQGEEAFMSNMAEKIPVIGKVVRASDRAYTGFLDKLRMDKFSSMVNLAKDAGRNPEQDIKLLRDIGDFIGNATGRGTKLFGMKSLNISNPEISKFLNTIWFSPKLTASRTTLLNPMYYVRLDPFVRKEALKSLMSFTGLALGTIGLATAAGVKVGSDIRSSDFGKIIAGNTRVDIWGSFQQWVVFAAREATGQTVSSTTGKTTQLDSGKYGTPNRFDVLVNMAVGKEAPLFSFLTDLMKGRDFSGQPINMTNEIASKFIPMVLQDAYDIMKDNPNLSPLIGLGVFGIGLQTYSSNKKTPQGMMNTKTTSTKIPSLKGLSK